MRSFSFEGRRSIIRFPRVLPIRTIAPVEIMFRIILVAVPALRRVEPAMISGPTSGAISRSASRPSRLGRLQAIPTVAAPRRFASRTAPSTYGVRPDVAMPTTRSSAPMSRRREVGRPPVRVVLGPLHGAGQRGRTPGDQADDHAGRRAERRRAFRGIQHPQPPRGARPDVDEPAPAPQPIGRPVDRTRDGLRLGADRLDHPGVLGIHQRDDLERAERVDRLGGRVPGFGEQMIFEVACSWSARGRLTRRICLFNLGNSHL